MRNSLIISAILLALLTFSANLNPVCGQIRGKLLKSDGKPLAYTEIEMVPVESNKIVVDSRLVAATSASGLFAFRLPAGKYTLSINFGDKPTVLSPYETFFYPAATDRAAAEVFEITEKSAPRTIAFRLPPALVSRKITGKIVDRNNAPVSDAWIGLRDVAFDRGISFGASKSDKLGNFSITALSDREYQIGAILFEYEPRTPPDNPDIIGAAESQIFTLNAETKPFKLVLKQRSDNDRIRDKYVGFVESARFENYLFGAPIE